MHRDGLLKLLKGYRINYPQELAVVDRLREFVLANQDCFQRSLKTGHVTGSAWVLDAAKQKVLLTHHKKLNIWVQLGGHADGHSNIAEVAMKEAEEESGLSELTLVSDQIFDIDIHQIPQRKAEPAHYHYDCRFLIQAAGNDYIVSEESLDLAWVPLTEVHKVSDELSLQRMVSKTSAYRF
ncbi:MAG: NUDIX hydrolase [Pseudomonadales bacterium]|nr:NUDIX hydrolase [Pseudomonadales bacterium]